jgi:hypothetical protein
MAIRTRLTEFFGLQHPIVLAPMTPAAGADLASAVSEAGGLGLLGGGYAERAWFMAKASDLSATYRGQANWCGVSPRRRRHACRRVGRTSSWAKPEPRRNGLDPETISLAFDRRARDVRSHPCHSRR